MPLNAEQQAAVEYIDGPLLVLAGPGTGKTQLLSTKVAYLLEQTDTNPENILCLTFTESGASNMRERLGTMIGRAGAKVNIFTYHAFGANILERYRNYAERLDRQLDSPIDQVAQYKIIREIQTNLPVLDILKTTEPGSIVETIQNAKSARLSSADLSKIAEQNAAGSLAISASATPILSQVKPRMKFDLALEQVYAPLLAELLALSDPEPIAGNIERTANLLARELANLIDEQKDAAKPSISKLSAWRKQRFELNGDGSYRLTDYIANRKLASLAHIMELYDQKLAQEGLFDFADMIEQAITALREDRGFRLSLSEIFQYIMLDEFQDTNPSQFELIKLLTDYESPSVMAVGDDDQAIFEFQGASASNLLDFQNHYQAKIITLVDNYRSTGKILDFSYKIAEQIENSFAKHHQIPKKLCSMTDLMAQKHDQGLKSGQTNTKELSAQPNSANLTRKSQANDHLESKSTPVRTIERHEFLAASDEYYWSAQRISALIKSGVSPTDIAVIAPKHKYIAPLLPYLQGEHIDIAYEKKSNLLEDEQLKLLLILAEFCDDLANERQPSHRLLEILALPFLEVEPLTAINAIQVARDQKRSTLDYLLKSDRPELANIARWLADLAILSFDTPLELWLDYLIGSTELPTAGHFRSNYLNYYQAKLNDSALFEFYDNLNVLKNAIINHTKTPRPKLADFVQTIRDYSEAGASIVNTSPYQDASASVQVMSAHKSKGLEFKYVFLIAVDELAWGKAKGNNNLFSLPNNLASIRHTGITDDEQLRLLFVAITRAKSHLIMTNSIHDFNQKPTERLHYLDEQRDEKTPTQISPFLPSDEQCIETHYEDFDTPTRITTNRRGWAAAYQILTPNLKQILQSRLGNYRLSATDLTNFIDIIHAGPDQVYRQRILHAPDQPLTSELAYGNLIHAVLEQITNQKIDNQAAFELFKAKAEELPLAKHDIEELQLKGQHSLEIILREFRDILRAEHAKGEVNLSPEHPVLDDIPLTGKIDHLEINPVAKTIEVYDFKTGKYRDKSNWRSDPTLYKYSLQLGFYKLLLNLSPTYRNYRVTTGHILFVSPDFEEQVYDKTYQYNEADETELKKLIRTVYHRITNLDFVENEALNLQADKTNTIKDIRNFVETLLEYDSRD